MLTATLLGLLLGVRHAADPDHLVAVSAMAAGGRGPRRSAWVGLLWGLGHATTVLVLGGALVALDVRVPERLGLGMEGLVGAVLIALGISNLRAWRRPARETALPRGGARSFAVGAVHGLAGTGALAVIAVAAMPSPAAAVAYLAVFGAGSIAGMVAVSLGLGVPLGWAAARPGGTGLLVRASGVVALAFGTWMVWRVGSGGLL